MKGIILAGGDGTRLYPATIALCKQLLPVYDKPMIYYPLATLMLAGIKEILIISTPADIPRFQKLFGNGSRLGLEISYKIQLKPEGIAQAFILGEDFIGRDSVSLILGDNIFYGAHLSTLAPKMMSGLIFGYRVKNPERYGVLVFDENQRVIDIEEKPEFPKSSYVVPGIYFYDSNVVAIAKQIKPSARGELEITDINRIYLAERRLDVHLLERGVAWLDAGTFDALQNAAAFVQTIQERQGVKIACIEEIALSMGYLTPAQFLELASGFHNNAYGEYLRSILVEETSLLSSH